MICEMMLSSNYFASFLVIFCMHNLSFADLNLFFLYLVDSIFKYFEVLSINASVKHSCFWGKTSQGMFADLFLLSKNLQNRISVRFQLKRVGLLVLTCHL